MRAPKHEAPGMRRLALLVGIGKYKCKDLPDLRGPRRDALAMRRLLTGPGGYGFHDEDVDVLLDEEATVERFRQAFGETLIERARPGDVALLYFAGHGSQAKDLNGDEPDGWDETLVFHDSRTGGAQDLVDDRLNDMLAALYRKTENITVVFDTCSSASATRGWAIPRAVPRASSRQGGDVVVGPAGEGWVPASLPGLVVLSAAEDGSEAFELESDGHGIFTSALIEVLGRPSSQPLAWAQVACHLPRRIAALSRGRQRPAFQGALHKLVFNARERRRPPAWEVTEVGENVELRGIHLPGWGIGARLGIFPGYAEHHEVADPSRAKARLRVKRYDGFGASAELIGTAATPIEAGDLAVLTLPSRSIRRIPLRVDAAVSEAFERALADNPEVSRLIERLDVDDAFTLKKLAEDGLLLTGPRGEPRGFFRAPEPEKKAIEKLGLYARQIALLMLEGSSGTTFAADKVLEVRVVPYARQENDLPWMAASANGEQLIPAGSLCQIEVKNTHEEVTLCLGGALLWSDGDIDGLPRGGEEIRLPPGRRTILDPGSAFRADPRHTDEHIVIFGATEDRRVDWSVLTSAAAPEATSRGGLRSPFGRTRAAPKGPVKISGWTSSHVPFRVVKREELAAAAGQRAQSLVR